MSDHVDRSASDVEAPGSVESGDGPPVADRVVGRVVKAHGLRGELAVDPSTDHPSIRFAPGAVLRVEGGRPGAPAQLTIDAARRHGERYLVSASEVADRDAAERLQSARLMAPPVSDEAPGDPDEFEDHQLEGLRVQMVDGTPVGTVAEVLHGAGGELLAIGRPDGDEVLVPFVRAIVTDVDVDAGRVVLDPPEGLLDPS